MSTPALLLGASTAELTLRMVVSLAVMGLAALLVTKLARGRLRLGGARAGIAVHARHQLTRNASVAVIRAGDRWLLVGVTDANVTVLAEGDDLVAASASVADALPPDASVPVPGSVPAPMSASAPGAGPDEPARRLTHHRARAADGAARRGAGKRHRRAPDGGPGRSRTSLIEALREKTVRR
ncbi:MAG: flagellar biosynthetic protein FliO [Acidimicrobiales bacterium]